MTRPSALTSDTGEATERSAGSAIDSIARSPTSAPATPKNGSAIKIAIVIVKMCSSVPLWSMQGLAMQRLPL
jgi:hypothetical protein